ncbi:MAG: restriction endonuclease subunit S [Euryarchaeota archaeon]|nr:restriction endonuclease subunit S [Euryarchaeota archaeon]
MSWSEIAFGDFAEVQPQVKLEKGTAYSFIEMSNVEPHTKSVDPRSTRIWKGSGGAKFENGDVIFARITPCLEHGKTAKIDNLTESRGFGSTEFFVFRGRDGISDPDYIYYLARSPVIREPAIKSMIGTSGRQRAQKTVVENTIIRVPEIQEQRRIASILSAYDDLIENNRRRIQLLEQAARLLYKEWFVHLRFPGHEHVAITDGVPEGWEKKKIADVCETVGGGTPSTKVAEYWEGDITWIVPSDITKNDCLALLDSERKITERGLRESSAKMVPAETILMTSRASVGFFALMDFEVCTNQGFISIIPHEDELRMYLLFNLMSRVTEIRSNAKGTTYPEISKGRFRGMDVIVPSKPLVSEFMRFASDIIQQVRCLKRSTLQLKAARDILLPRLMNGEVAV